MFITERTLDDLLHSTFQALLEDGVRVRATKGSNTELYGVLLELQNPRARLSRTETKGTVFSCIGETLWYLAQSNELDFIKYYLSDYTRFSDDNRTIYGAYGPRLFNMYGNIDQVRNVIRLLRRKRTTRQAVIQLFDARDMLAPHKDVPCTCTIQFLIRRNRLHAFTCMRSNDAFRGLPHDIFAFTFLQELVARSLGVKLGSYRHAVGSLHIYDENMTKAKRYLKEGWQSTTFPMPPMPTGNPWTNVQKLLNAELKIRNGGAAAVSKLALAEYWTDLVRLLQIYGASVARNRQQIIAIRKQMTSQVYDTYIAKRLSSKTLQAR